MLHHIAYVSTAVHLMSAAELNEILEQARAINREADVTGLLLYKDRSFIQVLEGEEAVLREIYGRIMVDPRHTRVTTLFDEALEKRDFGEWSMGFYAPTDTDMAAVEGYSRFLERDYPLRDFLADLTRARKLLLHFRARA
jgi:hypothetical protein